MRQIVKVIAVMCPNGQKKNYVEFLMAGNKTNVKWMHLFFMLHRNKEWYRKYEILIKMCRNLTI